MRIEADDFPRSGKLFRFTVSDGRGRTVLHVTIGNTRLPTPDCPDPPCHEMVTIPDRTVGKTLKINARDSYQGEVTREFQILGDIWEAMS